VRIRDNQTVLVSVRRARDADFAFMAEILTAAAFWRGEPTERTQDALAIPVFAHYLEGWPRTGDLGVIAEQPMPVGAAWLRHFTSADPGFGYVDDQTPEMTIGVVPDVRGRGLGTALLRGLITEARTAGIQAISLSVEPDNRATRLYGRHGFQQLAEVDGAWTMLLRLR
jgi:ribosomal protein S18 acetylase RimI-like enzyme